MPKHSSSWRIFHSTWSIYPFFPSARAAAHTHLKYPFPVNIANALCLPRNSIVAVWNTRECAWLFKSRWRAIRCERVSARGRQFSYYLFSSQLIGWRSYFIRREKQTKRFKDAAPSCDTHWSICVVANLFGIRKSRQHQQEQTMTTTPAPAKKDSVWSNVCITRTNIIIMIKHQ